MKTEGNIVPALTAYILWRCPKPENAICFKNFICHPTLSWPVLSLLIVFRHHQPVGMIIFHRDQWRFQQQGFNFSLCFGESRRWGNKTISPARPIGKWEENHTYLCVLAVHPLLPSLGPPFRPPCCPQGQRGSAIAGCGGSSRGVGVAKNSSSLQGLGGGEKILVGHRAVQQSSSS